MRFKFNVYHSRDNEILVNSFNFSKTNVKVYFKQYNVYIQYPCKIEAVFCLSLASKVVKNMLLI